METDNVEKAWKHKNGDKKHKANHKRDEDIENTTIMFFPSSKDGLLLKMLKERESEMYRITGFKIKFVEAGGTPLGKLFSPDLGKGVHCGRDSCPPCDNAD